TNFAGDVEFASIAGMKAGADGGCLGRGIDVSLTDDSVEAGSSQVLIDNLGEPAECIVVPPDDTSFGGGVFDLCLQDRHAFQSVAGLRAGGVCQCEAGCEGEHHGRYMFARISHLVSELGTPR